MVRGELQWWRDLGNQDEWNCNHSNPSTCTDLEGDLTALPCASTGSYTHLHNKNCGRNRIPTSIVCSDLKHVVLSPSSCDWVNNLCTVDIMPTLHLNTSPYSRLSITQSSLPANLSTKSQKHSQSSSKPHQTHARISSAQIFQMQPARIWLRQIRCNI